MATAVFNKKVVEVKNARCNGFQFYRNAPYPTLVVEIGGEVKVFSCVEQGGRYVSVNTDGVVTTDFSIHKDNVTHPFAETSIPYPVVR